MARIASTSQRRFQCGDADTEKLPNLLSPRQIAELEGVADGTVHAWLKSGKLSGYQVGGLWRVRRADYLAFRQSNN